MAVTDFDTKVGVVVRDDLAAWQRLNVTAFLMSGVTASAGPEAIGEPYRDADDRAYLPLLVQPVRRCVRCRRRRSTWSAWRYARSTAMPTRC